MEAPVFMSFRRFSPPQADNLALVRAAVCSLHDDATRTPGRERLAIAFGAVLREIDVAQCSTAPRKPADVITPKFSKMRR